mmetsp:Transcript_18676/g.32359  ORF Transcript_18676/g.32359 Transcript_18676/m.32359 type:complete len:273 (-) Transcript_18676:1409-2227(-)
MILDFLYSGAVQVDATFQHRRTLNGARFVVGGNARAHEIDNLQRQLLAQILARTERVIVDDELIVGVDGGAQRPARALELFQVSDVALALLLTFVRRLLTRHRLWHVVFRRLPVAVDRAKHLMHGVDVGEHVIEAHVRHGDVVQQETNAFSDFNQTFVCLINSLFANTIAFFSIVACGHRRCCTTQAHKREHAARTVHQIDTTQRRVKQLKHRRVPPPQRRRRRVRDNGLGHAGRPARMQRGTMSAPQRRRRTALRRHLRAQPRIARVVPRA